MAIPPKPSVSIAPVQQSKPAQVSMGDIYEVAINGNLETLSPTQRVQYLTELCRSLDLNPMTRPFAFIKLDGKMTVYALKECTAQLSRRDRVSVELGEFKFLAEHNMLECKARASTPDGRFTDEVAGIAFSTALKGDGAANARMKLATKAKRRAILSHCGLGVVDESELESISKKEYINEQQSNDNPTIHSVEKAQTKATTNNKVEISNDRNSIFDSTVDDNPVGVEANIQNVDAFNYNDEASRVWLLNAIKKNFIAKNIPVNREDIINLARTFVKCTTRKEIEEALNG